MRFILKLVAAPFALALAIISALLTFVLSMSDVLFGIVSSILFLVSVALFITGQTLGGAAWLVVAFIVSPMGIPAVAGWFVRKVGGAGGALRAFIFS